MKYESLIYSLCSIAVIGGALMKILHLPNANAVLIFAFTASTVYQTWLVSQLKKRVKELENK